MTWRRPLDYLYVPTDGHPGAFGTQRRYEIHTGVDLYAPEGTEVRAVESGVVVGYEDFTGPNSNPPSPWWLPTAAILIEGESGVVLYGEIDAMCAVGDRIPRGCLVGRVKRVLRHDKGLPTSMLHLELHKHGTTASTHPWIDVRPDSLLDPTSFLIHATDE